MIFYFWFKEKNRDVLGRDESHLDKNVIKTEQEIWLNMFLNESKCPWKNFWYGQRYLKKIFTELKTVWPKSKAMEASPIIGLNLKYKRLA